MAPRSLPKEFIGKTGKFDYKNFDYTKFNNLSASVRKRIVTDSIKTIQDFLRTNKFTEETREAGQILFAIDKANPSLNLGVYGRLLMSRVKHDSAPYLNEAMLNHLKQNDSYTFDLFARDNGWELYTVPDGKGGFLNVGDMFDNRKRYRDPETQTIEKEPEIKDVDSDTRNINTPAEPTEGALSNKPIDTASPAGPSSGALTDQPPKLPEVEVGPKRLSYQSWDDAELNEILAKGSKKRETNEKLPEISNQPELPNVGKTVEEAAANAYTGNEPPIAGYNTPITPPGVHVSFDEKPVNLSPEEVTKFNPNTASPSPEAIGEAMREAVVRDNTNPVGDTSLKPEDIPAFLTKEGGSLSKKEEVKATEGAAKATPETPETGEAATGKPAESSKGMFKRIGDWMHDHPKISWGVGGTTALGILGGIGISQADKIAEALKAGRNVDRDINEEPVTSGSANYRVWENYNPDYLNEEYAPGNIPSHIPQDNLASVKESSISKKVKNRPQQQKQQPQVINAPENNATADYVRAAYNSYIPSDAGRAYQKAIYGDPLELERNRQQQKWRDFVMRSGQSPAELVQRGLMPYDALQYI